jgi:PAS domain-containing protein
MLPSAVLYGLLYLGPWSALFVTAHEGTHQGPLYDIWTGYARGLVLLGALLFLRAALQGNRSVTTLALLAGVLIPVAGEGLLTLGLLDLPRDATPMMLGLALVPLRVAVFRGGLFDVVPVEQRDVLLQLPVGILLADDVRGVIEINPAAEARLALFRGQVLGRSLDAVLAEAGGDCRVRVEPLHLSPDIEIQCAVVLDDAPATPLRQISTASPDAETLAPATLSFGAEGSRRSRP